MADALLANLSLVRDQATNHGLAHPIVSRLAARLQTRLEACRKSILS